MGRLLLLPLLRTQIIHTVVSPSALKHLGFAVMFPVVKQPFAKCISEYEIREPLSRTLLGNGGLKPLEALGCDWIFASLRGSR